MAQHERLNQTESNGNPNVQSDRRSTEELSFYYPFIVETAQEGIWVLSPEGRTIYVNEAMAALLATTVEGMRDQTLTDYLFENDDQTACYITGMDSSVNNKPFECRYKKANGLESWVDATVNQVKDKNGNTLGIVAMHTDVTDRKQAENALQHSRENIGLIVDSVKDYAIMMVDANRRVMSWNAGAQAIFGYEEHEIVGQLSDVLFTAEDTNNNVPAVELETALRMGHSFDDRWHLRKDGSTFYASGVMTRLNELDESPKFVKIARDWTERKKLEEMLKKADRHKNEFLATLAHELRNPLASILSGIEVLKQEKDATRTEKTREIIERQVQQMIHLVNDLLDISRISLGKIKIDKQPVNLIDAIHLALETSRPFIEGYKHALTISLPGGQIIVNGDITRLSQVFLNILINSAKYTPPAGTITFSVYRQNNEVVIKVRDNGIGIPAHMLSSIFEMFEQIQDRSEYPQAGLGIGLSVVKELVEMHDGHVEAYSEGTNKGSEFVVKLPLYENQEIARQPEEKRVSSTPVEQTPASSKKKILLVDDNTDAADMMEILLKKRGYAVKKAYDGKTGISTALEFDPEIVLLDLGLPDINGYDVLKALQGKLGHCLYLALSGWGQEEDLARSKQAGFAHHLVKPIDVQSLDNILKGE